MTLDVRARAAAAATTAELEDAETPDVGVVVRRAGRRQRRRRQAAVAVSAVLVAALGMVVVEARDEDDVTSVAVGTDGERSGPVSFVAMDKASVGLPANASLRAIASDGTTMVLAGEGPAIWWSDDGERWHAAEVPAAGVPTAIAIDGDVAIATVSAGIGQTAAVWRSTDAGRSWDVVADRNPFGTPAPEMGRPFVSDLDIHDDMWVASGGAADGYAGIWVSRSGVDWRQVLASTIAGSVEVVSTPGGGLFAHGPSIGWVTADPNHWGQPVELEVPAGYYLSDVAPDASFAVGTSWERHDRTALLRSPDGGRTWTIDESFTADFPDAWLWSADRAGAAPLLTGAQSSIDAGPAAWVWRGTDGWQEFDDPEAHSGGTISLVATVADTTVMVGTAPESSRYYLLTD